MAKNAITLTTANPIQRKTRTTKCGIASSHLTSQRPRLSSGESSPVSWSGYVGVLVSITEPLCRRESDDGYGWGCGHVLVGLRLRDAENDPHPSRKPPVRLAE